MKTYNNLYGRMLDMGNIIGAIDKASKNKRKRRDVQKVLSDKRHYAENVRQMFMEHSYVPPKYKLHKIQEGTKRKKREIEKPHFKYDQIIQHVLITQLKPVIMGSLHPYAHGSLEKRGPLQTAKAISKWIKNDPRGTRYCLQLDLHHCYPSVDQEILIRMYRSKIKDEDFNIENDKVIRSCPKGLALGAPTSVWHIHFMLTPYDHWLDNQDGVSHHIRHMDDIIIFGPNKKKLHQVERSSIKYMRDNYNMEFNNCRQIFPIEWIDKRGNKHGRPLDVCGYLFYRDRTILRKSRMLGITRKARRIGKKDKVTHHDAEQMVSQMGWLNNSNTYDMYLEYVKPYVSKRKLRKIISKASKRKNAERRLNELQKSGELCSREAAGA